MTTLTNIQKQEFDNRLEIIGALDAFEYLYSLTTDKDVFRVIELLDAYGWDCSWSVEQQKEYEVLRDSILNNIKTNGGFKNGKNKCSRV